MLFRWCWSAVVKGWHIAGLWRIFPRGTECGSTAGRQISLGQIDHPDGLCTDHLVLAVLRVFEMAGLSDGLLSSSLRSVVEEKAAHTPLFPSLKFGNLRCLGARGKPSLTLSTSILCEQLYHHRLLAIRVILKRSISFLMGRSSHNNFTVISM